MNTISSSFFQRFSPVLMGVVLATLVFVLSFFFSGDAMAGFGVDDSIRLNDANDEVNLKKSIITMLNYFLGFVGILLVVYIVYAGFIIITSEGDDEKLTEGRKIIIYGLVGVVIIFLSYTIVNFIGGITDSANGDVNGQTG